MKGEGLEARQSSLFLEQVEGYVKALEKSTLRPSTIREVFDPVLGVTSSRSVLNLYEKSSQKIEISRSDGINGKTESS